MIYGQKILSDYLREHDDVGGRVVSHPPDGNNRASSWIMVTLLSAPQDEDSLHDWYIEFYFQIDCYAGATGGLPEAFTLGGHVRDAIVEMPATGHDDAVVTATKIYGYNPDLDTDMEPARDLVRITASCWMHPIPAAA